MKHKKYKEKKPFNYFHFVWVAGGFSILVLILVIVMNYKIYYEKASKYLYFYECDKNFCFTEDRGKATGKVYSSYYYSGATPTIDFLGDNYIIIDNKTLYNYITGTRISDEYDSYQKVGDNFIVSKNNKYGVIDQNNNIILKLSYHNLTSTDGTYFTISEDGINHQLIDKDNKVIFDKYNYIYEYKNIAVVVSDKKLMIKDLENHDLLDDPITTYEDINVTNDNDTLYIRVYLNQKYYKYSYNITTKELKPMSS